MGINSGSLSDLLTDPKAIGSATLSPLLDFKDRRGDFCATGASVADGVARFVAYAKSDRARRFVASYCSDTRFVEEIEDGANLLEKRSAEANQKSRDGNAKCVASYGNGEVIKRAADRYFLCAGADLEGEDRELCEFAGPIYADYVMSNVGKLSDEQSQRDVLQGIVQRFCRSRFGRAEKQDTRRLEDLRGAVKAFRTP
jgi:hypothetical protein